MIHLRIPIVLAAALALSAACTGARRVSSTDTSMTNTITTVTSDGVTIHGEPYFGHLGATTPLILLFHQGGSNGRGEYADIAPWLNEAGFRAIAWDQRAGGENHGASNRTVAGMAEGTPADYCDAYADLQAALDYVATRDLAETVVVWGSSYSAALAFRLAAENPHRVSGVIAFSPSAGGPLTDCRARMWVDEVRVPALVLRPASEMELAGSIEQRDVLTAAGVEYEIVRNGVHGSSMVVDGRTGHDMRAARERVAGWLERVTRQ